MAEYLLDTNVLSKIFYGNIAVKEFVDSLDAGIDTVVYIECIQGSISKRDRGLIKQSLSQLNYYSITPDVALLAIELIDKYSASKGLLLADALIAATAITYDLILVSYNIKHFRSVKELSVIEPKV